MTHQPYPLPSTVSGFCASQFFPLKEHFEQSFINKKEHGGALTVFHKGKCIIDLIGGYSDKAGHTPWHPHTLVNVFSCGKSIAAICALQLVEKGILSLDQPIADYWSAFAQNDKGTVTLRHILSHTSGLSAFKHTIPNNALFDWDVMIQHVETLSPWWEPGSAQGYAPMTFGWLLGEIFFRAAGEHINTYLQREIIPLIGEPFHFGVPLAYHPRISTLIKSPPVKNNTEASLLFTEMAHNPAGLTSRAFCNPLSFMTSSNSSAWHSLELVSASGHSTARGLATFYQRLLDNKLLNEELFKQAASTQSFGHDHTLKRPMRFGLGFMLNNTKTASYVHFGPEPSSFGHIGAGGSIVFADPANQLSFSYVTHKTGTHILLDPRADHLIKALYQLI